MELLKSVYSLARSNNGFFKSDKQAQFMLKMLNNQSVFIEWFYFGETGKTRYSRTVTVSFDDKGITKIKSVADISGKEYIKFTRLSDAEFNVIQQKKIQDHNAELLELIQVWEGYIKQEYTLIDDVITEHNKIMALVVSEMTKADRLAELPVCQDLFNKALGFDIAKHAHSINHWMDSIRDMKKRLK